MIELKNVCKSFTLGGETIKALDNVNFRVERGEFVSIIGPSGSGKSTLMNILGLLDVADAGEYMLDDISIKDASDNKLSEIRNKKIGFVFQNFNLLTKMNALENVQVPLMYRGEKHNKSLKIAYEYLEKVGLKGREKHLPSQLSGGQQQSVSEQGEEKKTTIKSSGEVKSALVEQIEPHASYYLEEICVEENQFVSKDSNILKYTNETYLTAPYDCVVTDLNLPELNEKLLNGNYIEISSNNVLAVTINVDETKISKVSVGKEAKIDISTLGKEYTGHVTNVASTGSNGKFKVTVEFENDGSIKLGMTANVEMII
ncbi:MAG: ATP-binding cassette domain-containing protein [Bacilli bacterium]|nr:ATP-binding cassette domain-containing protein [Bacilli bacterium]